MSQAGHWVVLKLVSGIDRTGRKLTAILRYAGLVLAIYWLAYPPNCQADSYLLVKSGNGEIYNRFEHRLKLSLTRVDQTNKLTSSNAGTLSSEIGNPGILNYDAIISIGIEASIAVSRLHTKKSTLMAMVPRQSFNRLTASGDITCTPENCRVIFLSQPPARQLRLIKLALPDTRQIAVISSSYSSNLLDEIRKTAAQFGMTVNSISATDENAVLTELSRNLANTDLLMAIPDPVVFNRNTARAILLSAFHHRVPLFAYSRSFVRAGATLGIYSTPEDIAQHVAELLSARPLGHTIQHTLYPKYFTIDVNQRAADALEIAIPDVQTLKERLMQYEK